MCLPALRALKDHFPEDDIYLVAKHHLNDLFQNLEEIKETLTIPDTIGFKNIFKIAKKLKKYHFDYGILFTNSFHSALLFKLSNIKNLTGYSKDLRGFLLNNKIKFPTSSDRDSNRHHIYFYMDLVDFFLNKTNGGKIKKKYSDELILSKEEKETIHPLLAELGINVSKRLIGISPSAAYGSAKQWLPERFGELIKRIRKEIAECEFLLFGSSKEREKISKIIETNTIDHKDGKTHNLAGQLSLRESITAISFCDVFVSNDSGLMHVASSLRVPLVAIFGPTQPQQTAPLREENKNIKILYHPVQCAPCLHRDCPLDHRCMKAISVDEVFDALVSLLSPSTSTLTST